MKDLRPITLCVILYKIIAKVLVNSSSHFRKLVRVCQNRSIMDNAFIAFEMIHHMSKEEWKYM